MTAYQIYRPTAHVLFSETVLAPGWKIKFFLTGTSTPVDVYTTAARNVAHDWPVEADSAGVLPVIYLNPSVVYKTEVYDQNDVLQPEYGADPANEQILTQAAVGEALYEVVSGGAEFLAGVTPTDFAYPVLNLRRYGGAPGSGDNTSAMDQAESVCAAMGGGIIVLDTPGDWKMNWTCTTRGVWVAGMNGQAEYNQYVIRPYNIATGPAITFGDGTTEYYYNGLMNIHMSGADGTAGSDTQYAKNASHCLLLKGGIVNFTALNCWFYNGIRTVSLEPSAAKQVTGVRFNGGGARNDLTDSTSARTIYGKRLADPGFYTDNVFANFKLYGPGSRVATTRGYLAEFDGTAAAMVCEFTDCYADFPADFAAPTAVCHGILLNGTVQIKSKGLQLDPGTTDACVIESTDAIGGDISRYIVGELRHGGQRMKFSDGTIALPAEGETFSYRQRISTAFLHGLTKFTTVADPYDVSNTAPYLDTDSATGPVTLNRADWSVKTAGKGLRIAQGSNAKAGRATLVGGTVTVSNTSVGANSDIYAMCQTPGGTPGWLQISARVNGTSFTILSSSATDTSVVSWWILEPA